MTDRLCLVVILSALLAVVHSTDAQAQSCVTTDTSLVSTVEAKVTRHKETGRTDLKEMFYRALATMRGTDAYTVADIKARPDKQGENWQGSGPNTLWQSIYTELNRLETCRNTPLDVDVNNIPYVNNWPGTLRLKTTDDPHTITLGDHFGDADDDTLSYKVSVTGNAATATITGGKLKITPKQGGSATVTVTASDGESSRSATTTVEVEEPPQPATVYTVSISADKADIWDTDNAGFTVSVSPTPADGVTVALAYECWRVLNGSWHGCAMGKDQNIDFTKDSTGKFEHDLAQIGTGSTKVEIRLSKRRDSTLVFGGDGKASTTIHDSSKTKPSVIGAWNDLTVRAKDTKGPPRINLGGYSAGDVDFFINDVKKQPGGGNVSLPATGTRIANASVVSRGSLYAVDVTGVSRGTTSLSFEIRIRDTSLVLFNKVTISVHVNEILTVWVNADEESVTEGASASFTATADQPLLGSGVANVSYSYTLPGGDPISGVVIRFLSGETTKSVSVHVPDNTNNDGDSIVGVTLLEPKGPERDDNFYRLAHPTSASTKVLNDDKARIALVQPKRNLNWYGSTSAASDGNTHGCISPSGTSCPNSEWYPLLNEGDSIDIEFHMVPDDKRPPTGTRIPFTVASDQQWFSETLPATFLSDPLPASGTGTITLTTENDKVQDKRDGPGHVT